MLRDKKHNIKEANKRDPEYLSKGNNHIRCLKSMILKKNNIKFQINTNFTSDFFNSLKNILIFLLMINLFC